MLSELALPGSPPLFEGKDLDHIAKVIEKITGTLGKGKKNKDCAGESSGSVFSNNFLWETEVN